MITTKWPRLLVVGEPVTPEQADEILIRTDYWHPSTNDQAWADTIERIAAEASGRPAPNYSGAQATRDYCVADASWRKRMGILPLAYLRNSRIASAWIGGAHGWCDWDGRIGCDTYNIGKWPEDDEVTQDWQAVAAAFPFLDLTAQCCDDEGSGAIAAQWRVREGTVEYDPAPTGLLTPPVELTEEQVLLRLLGSGAERGATEERLRSALERVSGSARVGGAE